jgi:hypothetical protein
MSEPVEAWSADEYSTVPIADSMTVPRHMALCPAAGRVGTELTVYILISS